MDKFTFYKLLRSVNLKNSFKEKDFNSVLTKCSDNIYKFFLNENPIKNYKLDNYTFLEYETGVGFTKILDSMLSRENKVTYIGGNNIEKLKEISFAGNYDISEIINISGAEISEDEKIVSLYLSKSLEIKKDYFLSNKDSLKLIKISEWEKIDFDLFTENLNLCNTLLSYDNKKLSFNYDSKEKNTTTFGLKEYETAIVGENNTFILKEENKFNIYCDNETLKEFDHINYFLFGISDATICFEETDEILTGVKFTYEKSSKYGDQIKITCNNLITDGYEEKYNEINPEATNVS